MVVAFRIKIVYTVSLPFWRKEVSMKKATQTIDIHVRLFIYNKPYSLWDFQHLVELFNTVHQPNMRIRILTQ